MAVIIMGGRLKGRRLLTDTRAGVVRPTSGKVREALFSSLGPGLPGASFADLYAGSGAVGLEAISRGASEAFLVENHSQSWTLLKANCRAVAGSGEDGFRVFPVREDALGWCRRMRKLGRTFPFVFADPPFGDVFDGIRDAVLEILAPGGRAVIQYPSRNPPAWAEQASKLKKYGESSLAFLS